MALEYDDDIEIGTPVVNITGSQAEVISSGPSDGLRMASIANALSAQGVSVQISSPSSPAVSGFNTASVGGVASQRVAAAPVMALQRNLT